MSDSKYVQGLSGLQASQGLVNRKWVINSNNLGKFELDKFRLVEEPVDFDAELPEGKALVKVEMLSCDAFVKTMLEPGAFHGTIPIGGVCPALGYGTIIKSAEGGMPVGTRVGGMVTAQTVALCDVGAPTGVMPFPDIEGMGPEAHLGLLGLTTGMTAYSGIFHCLKPPMQGEVCVVSAAAGAVGNIAAQLAKTTGAKVIGIAGGSAKCQWLTETLKLDGVVDYKDDTISVGEQLEKLCPDGINFFFDNVGGEILDEVLLRLAQRSRVVICGGISQYSRESGVPVRGPSNYLKLAERNSSMAGFVVTEYLAQYAETQTALKTLFAEGALKIYETKKNGIEEFPAALQGLFTGTTLGKTLVDLSAAPTTD